jgi:hypothetical protein
MPFVKREWEIRPGGCLAPAIGNAAARGADRWGGDSLTRELIARAHEGDAAALRLCIDRVLPRGSDRPVLFPLPRIESPEAAREAVGCITAAIGTGELSPREAVGCGWWSALPVCSPRPRRPPEPEARTGPRPSPGVGGVVGCAARAWRGRQSQFKADCRCTASRRRPSRPPLLARCHPSLREGAAFQPSIGGDAE